MNSIFQQLYGGLIVSCQAEGNSPFNNPADVAKFAIAALQGGANGIRTEGLEKTIAIANMVNVPVISLIKSEFSDGTVRITGTFSDVEKLISTGCHIIAIDGTFRKRENLTGPDFIANVKKRYQCIVMADIATFAEAEACIMAGTDCISTTLSGYTPDTLHKNTGEPDIELLAQLTNTFGAKIPVFAEGRFNTPAQAKCAIDNKAWAVVVGSAITRPHLITNWFSNAIKTV